MISNDTTADESEGVITLNFAGQNGLLTPAAPISASSRLGKTTLTESND